MKLTEEQIAKARECKSVDEFRAMARELGIEMDEAEATDLFAELSSGNTVLSDKELGEVSGGLIDSSYIPRPIPKFR